MPIEVKPDSHAKIIYITLVLPLQPKSSDKRTVQFFLMYVKAANTSDSTKWNCNLKLFSPT